MRVDLEKAVRGLILLINAVVIVGGLNLLATGRNANIFLMGFLSLLYTCFIMQKIRVVSFLQVLWAVWILYLCWNCSVSYTRAISMRYLILNFLPFMIFIFLEIRCSDCRSVIKFIRAVCIVYACSSILSLLMKDSAATLYGYLMAGGNPAGAAARIRAEIAIGSYSGLAGEKGYAALYMNMGIGLELSERCRKKKLQKGNAVLLLLYFIALLLASKRTFFVIAVMQCGLAVCLFEDIRNKWKNILIGIVIGLPCLVTAFLTIPALTNLFARFRDGLEDPSMMGRTAFWEFCLTMVRLKTAGGFGFGSFNDVYTEMTRYLYQGEPWSYHAHNIYLQILGEMGLIGFLLFIIPAVGGLILSLKLFHSVKEAGVMKQTAYAGMFLQVLFLAYGFTGNFIYVDAQSTAYFTGVLFTLTALRQVIRLRNSEEELGHG